MRNEPSKNLRRNFRESLTDEAVILAPSNETLDRTIERMKEIPGTEYVDKKALYLIELNEHFSSTGGNHPQRFLEWDSRNNEPEDPVIFLFLSDDGKRRLKKYTNWSADGTFRTAPLNMLQIYVICVIVNRHVIPCAFAFMANKSGESYNRLFQQIRTSLGNDFNGPDTILTGILM